MKKIITKENEAVVINGKDGYFWANLYVNARDGIDSAAITGLKWSGKTLKGAEKWAAKQFAA